MHQQSFQTATTSNFWLVQDSVASLGIVRAPSSSSSLYNSSSFSSMLTTLDPRIQSLAQIRRSTIVGVSELLKSSRTRPPVLKADSEATVEIGIAKRSRAMRDSIGNLLALPFQYLRMSNPSLSSSLSSEKYLSSSDLVVAFAHPRFLSFSAIIDLNDLLLSGGGS